MSFFGRAYDGQNTLLLPTPDPVITKVDCDVCDGKGYLMDEDDEPVTYSGITLQRVIVCETCGGTRKMERWR